ncbi:hypothetical protein EB118_23200 [bacterium]|jgi:hypothetical protein|nr:hypothetical protein [bacterium]
MATSGTTSFNLDIDELIQEAYERIGIDGSRSGYQLKSARRSINLLLSEWDNRGVHLWKVEKATVNLVLGQAEYNYAADPTNFPNNINDVLEAYVRNNTVTTNPVDISLSKIDRSAYASLPNKLSQGTPSQYYVQRTVNPSIFLYQTAGSNYSNSSNPSNYQFIFYYLARIEDAGTYTNTPNVVFRFLPALTSGLAYYLAVKHAPERIEQLRMLYEDDLQRALQEDSQRTSLYISPKAYFGDGM